MDVHRGVERGEGLLHARDFVGAQRELRAVLDRDPENIAALEDTATALAELGRFDSAEGALKRALALAPDRASLQLAMAQIEGARGDWKAALTRAEAASALTPEDPAVLAMRAQALDRLGRAADARAAIDRALAIAPDDPLLAVRYVEIVELPGRRYQDADQRLLRAVAEQPYLATAWRTLGRVREAAGRPADARAAYLDGLALPAARRHVARRARAAAGGVRWRGGTLASGAGRRAHRRCRRPRSATRWATCWRRAARPRPPPNSGRWSCAPPSPPPRPRIATSVPSPCARSAAATTPSRSGASWSRPSRITLRRGRDWRRRRSTARPGTTRRRRRAEPPTSTPLSPPRGTSWRSRPRRSTARRRRCRSIGARWAPSPPTGRRASISVWRCAIWAASPRRRRPSRPCSRSLPSTPSRTTSSVCSTPAALGDAAGARDHLERALRLDPASPRAADARAALARLPAQNRKPTEKR